MTVLAARPRSWHSIQACLLALALLTMPLWTATGWAGELAWTARTSMPTARAGTGAALGPDGRIYVAGGTGLEQLLAAVEAYDPVANTWLARASLPAPRVGLGLATGRDGKVYAIGGEAADGNALATVDAYDPVTDTWTARASMPTPRTWLAVVAAGDGRIYAIGGLAVDGTRLATVEAYDPLANAWLTRAPMPIARGELGAALGPGGRIYAVGGSDDDDEPLTAVEAYDPGTDTWSVRAPLLQPGAGLAVATGADGQLYAVGGRDEGDESLATDPLVDAYDPVTDRWAQNTALLPTSRIGLALVAAPDGRLYAIGGLAGGKDAASHDQLGLVGTVEAGTLGAQPVPTPTPVVPEFSPLWLFGSGALLLGGLAAGRRWLRPRRRDTAGTQIRRSAWRVPSWLVGRRRLGLLLALLLGALPPVVWDADAGGRGQPVTPPDVAQQQARFDTAPRAERNAATIPSSLANPSNSFQHGFGSTNTCAFNSGQGETRAKQAFAGSSFAQWVYVKNHEQDPTTITGVVTLATWAPDDWWVTHDTADLNFYMVPDAAYQPLVASGNYNPKYLGIERGRLEVEWEQIALPLWAMPAPGDRVQVTGAFAWDCGHWGDGYRSEIHPPRLLVVERSAGYNVANPPTGALPYATAADWPGVNPRIKRADIFASSDGGYARRQLSCFRLSTPCFRGLTWYQPLASQDYEFFVPAPPRPTGGATTPTLIYRTFNMPFNNRDRRGMTRFFPSFEVVDDPINPGVRVRLPFRSRGFDEAAAAYYYGTGIRLEVGWQDGGAGPAPRRVTVTPLSFRVLRSAAPNYARFRPELMFVAQVGDLQTTAPGITASGFRKLTFPGVGQTTSRIQTLFDWGVVGQSFPLNDAAFTVDLLPGQPLRFFMRAFQYYRFGENAVLGVIEHILTDQETPAWGIGRSYSQVFLPYTSSGLSDYVGDQYCPCIQLDYTISSP